jgi:predicted N-formylglutamate amidohydrolase
LDATEAPGWIAVDEPPAVEVVNAAGRGRAILVCDHASPRIPRRLGTLGLSEADRRRHVAWDIGTAKLARHLSALLDAPLALSGYSRLVVDCNRVPFTPGSIPMVSDGTEVPGNQDVDDDARQARYAALFDPYHRAIAAHLDPRRTPTRARRRQLGVRPERAGRQRTHSRQPPGPHHHLLP